MSDDGEELRLPHRRIIRRVTALASTSDSESDDGVVLSSRRKRMRVVSDEDTDSSGSSVGRPFTRRIRMLPQLRDSDNASDASEDNSHSPNAPAAGPSAHASGFASDSSEGNSEKCSICLMRFTNQEVGTPQTCEHIFCLDCITEWSKSVNTCPVDRITFNSIVVRACAGGRVLRTEPVNVMPRRSSVDTILLFDSRVCQICGDTDNEETMLLCDGCDLGYHMQCLNPPLSQIPTGDWHCPYCDNGVQDEDFLDIDDLMSNIDVDFFCPMGPRPSPLRAPRNVRRSNRHDRSRSSTSVYHRTESNELVSAPSTSQGSRSIAGSSSYSTIRRSTNGAYAPRRRKYNKRRTKTVILEYEVENNSKRPVVKKYKGKIKKKVKKRQSRTVARQKHVRESVRAKLATLKMDHRENLSQVSMASNEVQNLCIRRQRAGIPSLSLLGNPNELDYFSEDEHEVSEGASTAIAMRSTSNLLNAHRQTRRKMVTIPSPPHASSAPDFLSSILESQTLLHSKKSVLSISVDGNVNIKLETKANGIGKKPSKNEQEARLDLSKGIEGAKQTPSYPGHSRSSGGGWGGGYRGNYHRERGATGFGRGSYNEGDYPGGPQNRQGNHFHRNDAGHRDETEIFSDYARRPHRLPVADEPQFDRNRRYSDSNRGFAHSGPRQNDVLPHPSGPTHLTGPVHSAGAVSWRPYGAPPAPRPPAPPLHRHSFGGFDDPLDMRTGGIQPQVPLRSPLQRPDSFIEEARLPTLPPCRPLPNPPVFNFDTGTDLDKSEDERSDPDLVIDTDKYDPTEPTNDDDSPDEETAIPVPPSQLCTPALSPPPLPPELPQADALRGVLAGLDVNVPPAILDNAVRQVLHEHRDLLVQPPPPNTGAERSDEDSDGDCPNFSIYSATSVHIANNTSVLTVEQPPQRPRDDLEDLVQEDDDGPSPTLTPDSTTPTQVANLDLDVPSKFAKPLSSSRHYNFDSSAKKKSEEYKEKVSKRCPITTNTRNPIKIKLNTPSLIKRPVSLYDDDEEDTEEEPPETHTPESISKIESPAMTHNTLINFCKVSVEPSEQQIPATGEKTSETFKTVEELSQVEKNETDATNELKDKGHVDNDINKLQTVVNKQSDDEAHVTTVDNLDNTKADKQEHLSKKEEKLNGPSENKSSENEESSDNVSEAEEQSPTGSPPTKRDSPEGSNEVPEKMTESISETEDERSYTPCLDENKSKDTSLETDKDKRIEGLDTEMISEDEGNEMFSDDDGARSEKCRVSPPPVAASVVAEEEPPSIKKQGKADNEPKKKKKKDSKKEGKDRGKNKRKADVVFRKLSKSGKERNYREREKQAAQRERRGSTVSAEREKKKRKRKEKRKDLERYDVRTVVGDKRRKRKDAFGRDVSPRMRSRSPSLSSPRRSPTPRRRSLTPRRRSPSPRRRSTSPRHRSPSPRRRSPTPRRSSPLPRRRSTSPHRGSPTPRRRSLTPRRRSPSLRRRSPTPRHRSPTPRRRSPTPVRCSQSAARVSFSPVLRRRRSQSAGRPSLSPTRARRSRSQRSISPRATSPRRLPTSMSRGRRTDARPDPRPETRRRRGEPERVRKRRRSASVSRSPRPKLTKRKKRARSERATPRRRKSPRRRRARRRSAARAPEPSPGPLPAPLSTIVPAAWSPASLESRPPSPCTPPPALEQEDVPRRRRELERARHRRARDAGGASKEVFTSGDNILVSVSFKEQERGEDSERRSRRKERRRRKRRPTVPEPDGTVVRPVAIIDLERSPFRELTPSPRDVIVLSDSDAGEREASDAPSAPAPPQQAGGAAPPPPDAGPAPAPEERGPTTPPDPPDSPDAYDPYEPTRSASGSPSPAPPASPPRTAITLETAQKTNMSADEVIDRRPLSPIEKVMALLQSTREVSPDPPPQEPSPAEMATVTSTATVAPSQGVAPAGGCGPPASGAPASAPAAPPAPPPGPPVRIVLPEATRPQAPKLFLAKPSPIKSDPIKPMPKPSRPPPGDADSPYSPGSSDFGELFSPPGGARRDPFDALIERAARRSGRNTRAARTGGRSAARVPVRLDRHQGKTQVGVKIDEDNLKILDDLPSSAVEMQVKSKFLKKLNRQERVVEEVKLVLKPHYNKKHVTKDEYKDILRRAVPKICHNKSGEINPTKIQALIEAYVKKIRKKHKLGLL